MGYIRSPVYVDALVLRDRDSNADGTLDERLYVAQDANYNVIALFDNSGNVVERYVYDPFGSVTVLDRTRRNILATHLQTGRNAPAAQSMLSTTCTRAAGLMMSVACITSATATTPPPSAAGPASTRYATTPRTSTSTGHWEITL